MSKFVLTAEKVLIAGNDLSTYCSKAEITISAEIKDTTNYGSGGWKEELGGLRQAKLSLEFYNDFATTLLDSIMFPLLGTIVTFEVAGTQAARGVSNPSYIGSLLVSDWNPLTGKVGDVDTSSVSYQSSGIVTRVTS